MKKFFRSKTFLIPAVLVFILGVLQIHRGSDVVSIPSGLTASLVAALVSGVIIGGVVYLTFELTRGARRK